MTLRILMAQLNLLVGDVEGNADRVVKTALRARDEKQANVIVFPELTLTSYPPEDLLFRDELHQRIELALQVLQNAVAGIAMVVGYPRRKNGKLYNVAGVFSEGRIIAEYHKAELPNYSVFDEKRYFEPGYEACVVELSGVPVGITICEDVWQSAPTARAAAAGARILLNLNASPYHTGKAPEREELVARRARENDIHILYVNLVGGQDELVFDGGSFVMDSSGRLRQRSPFFEESHSLVVFNEAGEPMPAEIAAVPQENAAIYAALMLGVKDYVRKNGFHGVVLGLSGGIDSALTLAIAVDALGQEQVEVVLMPSRYTSEMSNQDAARQAEDMRVRYSSIPIEPAFNAFLEMLSEEFKGLPMDVTEENIQARCRGIILMAISNKTGRMLLTTGNKSEMSVGYATLYGDMAGGFAPLKDTPKTLVYELARWRNEQSRVIPERAIDRAPSAELRPDQKDTDSLPDYAVLDEILRLYIENDFSVQRIVEAGYDEDTVRHIARMVDVNEYKRRQAPPGVRISRRAFGRDRRYPISRSHS